ncbi:MAG: hypothetical protein HZA24_03155 [Nitrospirae bacterium]|nr:hypothetical protein [Nitrospirota bacterium]
MADSHAAGPKWSPRMPPTMALLGMALGGTVYYMLIKLLGVHVEVWQGVNTFTNPRWFAVTAVAPALSGFVTGIVAGHNGKWYAMAPVAVLHTSDYLETVRMATGQLTVLGPVLFVFFMIVMLELALMAGWGAELLRARMAGKDVRA